jgi:hypothetical protein
MASRLQDVILRDTRANQPAATAVAPGTLFYVTDESVTERSSGTAWEDYTDGAAGSGITQLTGNVTAGPGSGSQVATIANDAVTFAKMQNISSDRLLGRDTAAAGDPEELQVANGIEFSGTPGIRQTTAARTRQIGITIDGGGSALTTGLKGYKSFPVAGTITGVRLLADQSGSIVIDIWKDTFANYPPVNADSITAAAPPTISGADKSEDTTLTGWTTSVSAGDVFGFNIDSITTITRITLELTIVVTG